MRAVTESDVTVRPAIQPKLERMMKHVFVPVAGRKAKHNPVALADRLATNFAFACRDPDKLVHRRRPPDRLFDERRNETGIVSKLTEQLGALDRKSVV